MKSKRDVTKLTGLLSVAAHAGQALEPTGVLPITRLRPLSSQPRREFADDKIHSLAVSIREHGILQPILVRPKGTSPDDYEIVAGERRYRAALLAGLSEVPVLIRTLNDVEARQVALLENLQREDLNILDEVDAKLELVAVTLGTDPSGARGRLMQMLREQAGEEHRKVEELFAVMGESWPYFVKNKLRILRWPEAVLAAVRGGLPFTLGAVVAAAPETLQARLLRAARGGASREELRAEVKRHKDGKTDGTKAKQTPQFSQRSLAALRELSQSSTWLGDLPKKEKLAVERWISEMPTVLKRALGE